MRGAGIRGCVLARLYVGAGTAKNERAVVKMLRSKGYVKGKDGVWRHPDRPDADSSNPILWQFV